jgi:hypothetical protein
MKLNHMNIKVAITISFTLVVAFIFAFSPTNRMTHASLSGAPTGRTGAPGESTCTGCHNANAGTGTVSLVVPATYVPGQTYIIQVKNTTTDLSRTIWGFETIPVTTANAMAGSVAIRDANTRVRASGTKNYMTHTTAGTFPNQTLGSNWSFNWTAPATNVGAVTFYAAGLHGDNSGDEVGDETYTTSAVIQPGAAVVIHHGFTDFDGDGKADSSVYRSSDRFWYINRSTLGFTSAQLGISTDKLAPADYDGDDKTDIAVWREAPAGQAAFYILQSLTNTVRIEQFGQTGDDPTVVGDWDGDGKADPAVFRDSAFGSQSYFFYRGSLNNPSGITTYAPWGTTGDKAMRGDFDGDGKQDRAVYRPSTALWYIGQSSNGTVRYENWGLATDKFVPADFDGDGKTDLAVFRAGVWYIKQSSNSQAVYYSWGLGTDTLVPADFDGDGKTDPAVYRNGVWYTLLSSSGNLSILNFGNATDKPIASSFVK